MSSTAPARDIRALIDLTHTTQTLLSHFQSSLAPPPSASSSLSPNASPAPAAQQPATNPLDIVKTTATLLKSHTTTLSLLLLTPPLSPTAISRKIGDVSAGCLTVMVAAASPTPITPQTQNPTAATAGAGAGATAAGAGEGGERGRSTPDLGALTHAELAAAVRRVLSGWSDVLSCVRGVASTPSQTVDEPARKEILAATGVVWEGCDALLALCEAGVVGLVVKKAEEWRAVLLDAVAELKEWAEEAEEDGEDDGEGQGEASAGEDEDEGFEEIFGAANKLGKGDKELRALLEASVKKLKTVAVLYQALVKRRLKTFPPPFSSSQSAKDVGTDAAAVQRVRTLDELMMLLKSIPESVDELASAFYDLDSDEVKALLAKCCDDAVRAATIVKQSWDGKNDEFTAWSGKWRDAMGSS